MLGRGLASRYVNTKKLHYGQWIRVDAGRLVARFRVFHSLTARVQVSSGCWFTGVTILDANCNLKDTIRCFEFQRLTSKIKFL